MTTVGEWGRRSSGTVPTDPLSEVLLLVTCATIASRSVSCAPTNPKEASKPKEDQQAGTQMTSIGNVVEAAKRQVKAGRSLPDLKFALF